MINVRLFRRRTRPKVNIEKKYKDRGIKFTIYKDDQEVSIPIKFTINELRQLDNLDKIQLLDDLEADQVLVPIEDSTSYILTYDHLYELSEDERKILDLPYETMKIEVYLENDSYVGASNFKFTPKISSEKYPRLEIIGKRKGAVIELPSKEVILMEQPYYHFFKLLDQQPKNKNIEELMAYVAEVKNKAISLDIKINSYLENENYVFIDNVDIRLNRDDEGIEILPQLVHDSVDEEVLNELTTKGRIYTKKGNKRILVKKNAISAVETVKNMPKVSNKEIPRFVQNPDLFYDESMGISLEDFSDRVKDLKIRVYKAQPFVHANKNDRGWFNYETGFKFKDELGNEITQKDETYFQDHLNDDFKQIGSDTYVELPKQVEQFQELATKVKRESNKKKSSLSNYVLDIFKNFTEIEYNKPLFELKEDLSKDRIFDEDPPQSFQAILKPFQAEGFKWMKSLRATGNGGLLADDMGLGKTVQVIAYLTYLKEQKQLTPSLIVAPKSVIENWRNEINRFAPLLSQNLYIHLGQERLKDESLIKTFDIVLTTYQTLTRDQLILGKVDWQMVICDEAQAIKNPTTSVSNVIKALKNKGRLALTGTPVENNLTELWSIIDFVQPGLLGSLNDFKNKYENNRNFLEVQAELIEKMKFIYLRRTKSKELEGQLPAIKEVRYDCKIGREQDILYREIISKNQAKEICALDAIRKLKMVCSHPGLIDSQLKKINPNKVPKLKKTLDILKNIKDKQEKAIIFTEFRQMQAILKSNILEEFSINAQIINGTTGHQQKIIDNFNRQLGFDVLILSPRAAGTGLTITGANHVIHYTRWWNPAVENQATDRVYRIGQEKDVTVYYPIVVSNGNSVEEVVDELLLEKEELAHNIVVPNKRLDIENELRQRMKVS